MNVLSAVVLCLVLAFGSAVPLNRLWKELIRKRRDVNICQPPENVDELFRHLNQNVDSTTYLRPSNLSEETINPESVTAGTQTCPDKASSNPDDPLSERSLCPWYYNITELPSGHYPRFIPQAVCKCNNCIDTSSNLNQCERVSTEIRVLQETGCQDGFKTYKAVTKTQYVGCTCAKRRTSPSVPEPTTATPCGPFGCMS